MNGSLQSTPSGEVDVRLRNYLVERKQHRIDPWSCVSERRSSDSVKATSRKPETPLNFDSVLFRDIRRR